MQSFIRLAGEQGDSPEMGVKTAFQAVLVSPHFLFRVELDRFQDGLFFYYFSSVDQNSHMLWGRYDGDLLEIYRERSVTLEARIPETTAAPLLMISRFS